MGAPSWADGAPFILGYSVHLDEQGAEQKFYLAPIKPGFSGMRGFVPPL
jgi:hypothetical protein